MHGLSAPYSSPFLHGGNRSSYFRIVKMDNLDFVSDTLSLRSTATTSELATAETKQEGTPEGEGQSVPRPPCGLETHGVISCWNI